MNLPNIFREVPRADEGGAAGGGGEDQRAGGRGLQDQETACE